MRSCSIEYVCENICSKFIRYCLKSLNLSTEDREKLLIGATITFFNILEALIVIIFSLLFGVLKETILFSGMFIPLRMLAAGVHCKKGSTCLLMTSVIYIGSAVLSKYYCINNRYVVTIVMVCIILLFKYAPADTENRPIIGSKNRKIIKVKTLLMAALILIINLFINNSVVFNCAVYAFCTETISILPLTYKIFRTNYNNYELYE